MVKVKKVTKKSKKSRKNIRKVIHSAQLSILTKIANKNEVIRKERVGNLHVLYNQTYDLENSTVLGKLVLDFDLETHNEIITVDENIVKKLMPYQAKGIKFMWDACYESIERLNVDIGSGCILAHCMGLGKTLQIVALTHTLLTHKIQTHVERVLILCPVSVILNWVDEFNKWVTKNHEIKNKNIKIFEITKCKPTERAQKINEWYKEDGVIILGYESFRNLINTDDIDDENSSIEIKMLKESLINPGPDLVVCDEGHLLKNEKTSLSDVLSNIRTLRRIALTGTPLQNNLKEYFCMVDFIKPHLLGTMKEFCNRFANPIENGQFTDSTVNDIALMTRRLHVLHKLLDGSIHRVGLSVLEQFLPAKHEYVVYVRLTKLQAILYKQYMVEINILDKLKPNNSPKAVPPPKMDEKSISSAALFKDYHQLKAICSHPSLLKVSCFSLKHDVESKDEESDADESGSENSTHSTEQEKVELNPNWWKPHCPDENEIENMECSAKIITLFSIIAECELISDKVLVFSQSLILLDLIEKYLKMIHENTENSSLTDKLGGFKGRWIKGEDYFRLDGSLNAKKRKDICDTFNDAKNSARLCLISTQAGCLGINMVGANRVIIFDASWNPSSDTQGVHRVYRHGQKKTCYIYRLIAVGTMEEKIYKRQVTKISLSKRVLDAKQIDQHFESNELAQLYCTKHIETSDIHSNFAESPMPSDDVLAKILLRLGNLVQKYHIHDTLLEGTDQQLTAEEQNFAWEEFEDAKKAEKIGHRATKLATFSCLENQEADPQEMDIFGFTTSNLLRLLSLKAQRDTGKTDVAEEVPILLTELHNQMAEGQNSLYNELLQLDTQNKH